jgi:hypothetical protein
MVRILVMLAILAGYGSLPVLAAGNLAIRAERLEELKLDAAEGFSVKSYRIETGKFYRWRIASDGREEYKLLAPMPFALARLVSPFPGFVLANKSPAVTLLRLRHKNGSKIDLRLATGRHSRWRGAKKGVC